MRMMIRTVMVLLIVIGLAFLWPRPQPDVTASFESLNFGEGIDVYLESIESLHDDIRPGQAKQVIWAGQRETRTPLSIVYLHGFSASSDEIRPVPDQVAQALGANLVYERLAGHGRSSPDAMADGSVAAWMKDTAEALALGRATGDRVIVISTSTGGTLMAEAVHQPDLVRDVTGLVFISPNFGINNPAAFLLTGPGRRHWVPLIIGQRQSFPVRSAAHAAGWTTDYPTSALYPMADLVRHAASLDYSDVEIPALFYFSDDDQVVRADVTQRIAKNWGGPVTIRHPDLGPQDDPYHHVIAGDVMSPGTTQATADMIVDWIRDVTQ